MKSEAELKAVTQFVAEYATRLMGSGVHTSRVVRNTKRLGEALGVRVMVSAFQKVVTFSVYDDESGRVYSEVADIPPLPISFELNSELSALSWDACDLRLPLAEIRRRYDEIVYTSPDGVRYDQHEANRLSTLDNIIILCGHYKGIDHRIREHLVTREISIGDYVLTGGELAACIIADSVVRIIPGAIGDEASALTDSFQDNLLAPPVYTRPAEFRGWRVPDVLLSGNFAQIARWQEEQSYQRTRQLRPDLLNEE